jgi:hypothetical protein
MAKRKTVAKQTLRKAMRKAAPARRPAPTVQARAKQALQQRWNATLKGLTAAQRAAEKQVGLLLERNRIGRDEAGAALKQLAARFARERRKLARQLDGSLKTFQGRLRKQRKVAAHNVGEAVHRTLAALNIPSRQEIAELTAKVSALSRKIDNLKRA